MRFPLGLLLVVATVRAEVRVELVVQDSAWVNETLLLRNLSNLTLFVESQAPFLTDVSVEDRPGVRVELLVDGSAGVDVARLRNLSNLTFAVESQASFATDLEVLDSPGVRVELVVEDSVGGVDVVKLRNLSNLTFAVESQATFRTDDFVAEAVPSVAVEFEVAGVSSLDVSRLNASLGAVLVGQVPVVALEVSQEGVEVEYEVDGAAGGVLSVDALAIVCLGGQYLDLAAGACFNCSACPASSWYQRSACTNFSDAVCAPCAPVCAAWEYEACACREVNSDRCATGNRVCFAQPTWNATLDTWMVSEYGALALTGFVPLFEGHLGSECSCVARVAVSGSAQQEQAGRRLLQLPMGAHGSSGHSVTDGQAGRRLLQLEAGLSWQHNLTVSLSRVYALQLVPVEPANMSSTGNASAVDPASNVSAEFEAPDLRPLIQSALYSAGEAFRAGGGVGAGYVRVELLLNDTSSWNASRFDWAGFVRLLRPYLPWLNASAVPPLTTASEETLEVVQNPCAAGLFMNATSWRCVGCRTCLLYEAPCGAFADAECLDAVEVQALVEGATHALSGVLDLGSVAAALASKLNRDVAAGLRGVASSDPGGERGWLVVQEGANETEPGVYAVGDARRRLLLAEEPAALTCPAGSYAYPPFALCVPCSFDPNPFFNTSLPVNSGTNPAYRYSLLQGACPASAVRVCKGGNATSYECVSAASGTASLGAVSVKELSPPTCPAQQELRLTVIRPGLSFGVCVGVPCRPGWTGQPGVCSPCAPGGYKVGVGSGPCVDCGANTFSPVEAAEGNGTCLPCPAHASSPAASFYVGQCACDAGFGFAGSAETSCAACGAGRYKARGGNRECDACPTGRYFTGLGSLNCAGCPEGTFMTGVGATTCTLCAPGTASPVQYATAECAGCGAGRYAGVPGLASCAPCPLHAYGVLAGQTACLACGAGQYANATGSTACAYCANGTGWTREGSLCAACGPGTFGVLGVCRGCAPGTYATGAGLGSAEGCRACAPGRYSFGAGATACPLCPAGRSGADCAPCPAGSYQTGVAARACQRCGPGTYSTGAGLTRSACRNCPAGTYGAKNASACEPCGRGLVSPAGATERRECVAAAGFFGRRGEAARRCPAGSFCAAGVEMPSPCVGGSSSAPGASRCTPGVGQVYLWDYVVGAMWALTTAAICVGFWRCRRRFRPRPVRRPEAWAAARPGVATVIRVDL